MNYWAALHKTVFLRWRIRDRSWQASDHIVYTEASVAVVPYDESVITTVPGSLRYLILCFVLDSLILASDALRDEC